LLEWATAVAEASSVPDPPGYYSGTWSRGAAASGASSGISGPAVGNSAVTEPRPPPPNRECATSFPRRDGLVPAHSIRAAKPPPRGTQAVFPRRAGVASIAIPSAFQQREGQS